MYVRTYMYCTIHDIVQHCSHPPKYRMYVRRCVSIVRNKVSESLKIGSPIVSHTYVRTKDIISTVQVLTKIIQQKRTIKKQRQLFDVNVKYEFCMCYMSELTVKI